MQNIFQYIQQINGSYIESKAISHCSNWTDQYYLQLIVSHISMHYGTTPKNECGIFKSAPIASFHLEIQQNIGAQVFILFCTFVTIK